MCHWVLRSHRPGEKVLILGLEEIAKEIGRKILFSFSFSLRATSYELIWQISAQSGEGRFLFLSASSAMEEVKAIMERVAYTDTDTDTDSDGGGDHSLALNGDPDHKPKNPP